MFLSRSLAILTMAGLGIALAFVPGDGDAAAVPAASGTVYGGATSQDSPFALVLSADRRRVSHAMFYVEARCSDGTDLPYFAKATLGRRLPRSGAFAWRGTDSRSNGKAALRVTERIQGSVRRSRAAGTFTVAMELVDKASGARRQTCRTATLRWSAASAPGRVYAGQTDAGGPVVVQLDRARRQITTFRAGWIGTCTKSGPFGMGEHLSEVKVARSGAFADSLSEDEPVDGGGTRAVDVALSGRMAATRASGVYRYSSKDKSKAGKIADICDSSDVHWSARSSAR